MSETEATQVFSPNLKATEGNHSFSSITLTFRSRIKEFKVQSRWSLLLGSVLTLVLFFWADSLLLLKLGDLTENVDQVRWEVFRRSSSRC